MSHATAPFTNDTYNEDSWSSVDGIELGSIQITRSFKGGDLKGEAKAELLTARTPDGTAVYLALDRIEGVLAGKQGSFVLQHQGTVTAEGSETSAKIVPGSGTGELEGITGSGEIAVDAGENHTLKLAYELA